MTPERFSEIKHARDLASGFTKALLDDCVEEIERLREQIEGARKVMDDYASDDFYDESDDYRVPASEWLSENGAFRESVEWWLPVKPEVENDKA